MNLRLTAMGIGRHWLNSLMSTETYFSLQMWAGFVVLVFCVVQLHVDRKFRWPPEVGRLTVFGYWIGLTLRTPHLTLWLGDKARYFDFTMTILGRLGIAGQGVIAVFAIDDSFSRPAEPRSMLTAMLLTIVAIQLRTLTAYTPRAPRREERL